MKHRNRWLLLGVGLGVVLALALAFSLRPDPEAPPELAAPTPPAGRPHATPPPLETPAGHELASTGAALDGGTSPAAGAPPSPAVDPQAMEGPPPPLAENPFATEDSRELDYAFFLALGPDSGVESAKVAIDVFQRCLEASPHNRRCYDGLVAAQQRLQPGWTPPAAPTGIAPQAPLPKAQPSLTDPVEPKGAAPPRPRQLTPHAKSP
ncbi:MAG: hypothetical protein AB1938_28505 [Myxococcota bacterium]